MLSIHIYPSHLSTSIFKKMISSCYHDLKKKTISLTHSAFHSADAVASESTLHLINRHMRFPSLNPSLYRKENVTSRIEI